MRFELLIGISRDISSLFTVLDLGSFSFLYFYSVDTLYRLSSRLSLRGTYVQNKSLQKSHIVL
jgi:hypothetical protein